MYNNLNRCLRDSFMQNLLAEGFIDLAGCLQEVAHHIVDELPIDLAETLAHLLEKAQEVPLSAWRLQGNYAAQVMRLVRVQAMANGAAVGQ